MTNYPQAVREKAAQMANAENPGDAWSTQAPGEAWDADLIVQVHVGRALCKAVADGLLHLDPVELDRARWKEACKLVPRRDDTVDLWVATAEEYRRLVREGWTPPEPVDPVLVAVLEEAYPSTMECNSKGMVPRFAAALDKLGLDIVKREAGQ